MSNEYVIGKIVDARDNIKWLFDKQPLDPKAMDHLGIAHANLCKVIEIEELEG